MFVSVCVCVLRGWTCVCIYTHKHLSTYKHADTHTHITSTSALWYHPQSSCVVHEWAKNNFYYTLVRILARNLANVLQYVSTHAHKNTLRKTRQQVLECKHLSLSLSLFRSLSPSARVRAHASGKAIGDHGPFANST